MHTHAERARPLFVHLRVQLRLSAAASGGHATRKQCYPAELCTCASVRWGMARDARAIVRTPTIARAPNDQIYQCHGCAMPGGGGATRSVRETDLGMLGRGEGARGCACDLRASTRRMREEEKSGHTTAEYPVVATRTFKGCAPWREAVTTTVKRFNLDDPASGPHEWQPD